MIGPDFAATAELLRHHLAASRFAVAAAAPGIAFLQSVRQERPDIAVLDHVNDRPHAAEMELAILKELRPDVRIIVVNERQSPEDAWVAERGVFFFTTLPPGPELVRVIEAAAQAGRQKSMELYP